MLRRLYVLPPPHVGPHVLGIKIDFSSIQQVGFQMICGVCFDNIPDYQSSTCTNLECKVLICDDCFGLYINSCSESQSYLKCIGQGCGGELLEPPAHLLQAFTQHYSQVLQRDPKLVEKNQTKQLYTHLISKIREEKHKKIETFLPAIKYVVDHALQNKVKEMTQTNRRFIHNQLKMTDRRSCPSNACMGTLYRNECSSCLLRACPKCWKALEEKHQCDPNELVSLELVSSLVQCPSCHVPVTKSEGCNSITCPYCSVNFNYITGKRQESGNHDNRRLQRKDDTLLGLTQDPVLLAKLVKIQELEPKLFTFNLKEADSDVSRVNKYCKSKVSQWKRKFYFQWVDKIYAQPSLDLGSLDKVYWALKTELEE